jgi:rfaE bifunctional protein kinase chain/domain
MAEAARMKALPSLRPLTEAFPKRRVLVVGDLVADQYIYGQTDRVSREAPVLIVRYEASAVKLGGAANAAANLRSLGGQVSAVGVLGDDEMGGELRKLFKELGIKLFATQSEQTETKIRILAGGVNTTRQQMLRLDRGATAPLATRLRKQLAQSVTAAAKGVDAILVSDYGAGVVDRELRAALETLAKQGHRVMVDSRYQLAAFRGMTLCKPNEPELETLTRMPVRTEQELIAAGKRAVEMLACRALLVTRGRNGMAVFDDRGTVELIPVHGREDAVDVTGAGDTVMAALTLAFAAGGTLVEAAHIANVAGGLVVQKEGTATITRAELVRELK